MCALPWHLIQCLQALHRSASWMDCTHESGHLGLMRDLALLYGDHLLHEHFQSHGRLLAVNGQLLGAEVSTPAAVGLFQLGNFRNGHLAWDQGTWKGSSVQLGVGGLQLRWQIGQE